MGQSESTNIFKGKRHRIGCAIDLGRAFVDFCLKISLLSRNRREKQTFDCWVVIGEEKVVDESHSKRRLPDTAG